MRTIDDSMAAGLMSLGGDMYGLVEKELRMGFELERQRAFARQREIAKANARNPRKSVEGLGQVTMSIDPVLRLLAERQYGHGCFRDKRFVKELLRDNPELRVTHERKAMIVAP
jgi:hypothetical protein